MSRGGNEEERGGGVVQPCGSQEALGFNAGGGMSQGRVSSIGDT